MVEGRIKIKLLLGDPSTREVASSSVCLFYYKGEDGNNCVGVLREVTGSDDFMSTNQTPVLQLHPRYQVGMNYQSSLNSKH